MFLTLLSHLTHLILILSTTLFGVGALQQVIYRQKIVDVDQLKQLLNSCWDWDMISQQLMDGAIEQWSKHIEHRFS